MRRLSSCTTLLVAIAGAIVIGVVPHSAGAEEAYPAEWDALDGAGLIALAKGLADQGGTGQETRVQLTGFLASKYLTDAEATRSLTCYEWRELAWYLRSDMSKETRATWADKITKAYAGSRQQLLALDAPSFAYLARAVGSHLGHGKKLAPLAAVWIVEKDSWKSLDLFELDWLSFMAWKAGGLGHSARQRLGDHLTTAYFTDPKKVRSAGVKRWYWFTFYLGGALSNETREVWVTRLYEAFASTPEAVAGLDAKNAGRLENTLKTLCSGLAPEARKSWFTRIKAAFAQDDATLAQMPSGEIRSLADSLSTMDGYQAAKLALKWFETHSNWQAAPARDLVGLAFVAVQGDKKATAPLMDDLEQAWLAAESRQPLDLSAIYRVMRTWSRVGDDEMARAWVMRAYAVRVGTDEGRNSVDLVSLGRLADFMRMVGLTGKGKGYPAFAAALARHARAGTLAAGLARYAPRTYWAPCDPELLALPLGTPESRVVLQDDLVDGNGNPRLGVAKVLAWAYRNTGETDQWLAFLGEKTARTDGDAKALWCVAKAYADPLVPTRPNARRMKKGLDSALAAAATDQGRLIVLREYVDHYKGLDRPTVAADLLESIRGQFGEESLAAIDAMQEELRREEVARKASAAQHQAAVEAAHKRARLKYALRRLSRAQAAGDSERVAQLEAAIEKLEAELKR